MKPTLAQLIQEVEAATTLTRGLADEVNDIRLTIKKNLNRLQRIRRLLEEVESSECLAPTAGDAMFSPSENTRLARLSQHEWRILEFISQGLSNRQIGIKLNVSEKTIRNYVSAILSKLHLINRTQAAVYFFGSQKPTSFETRLGSQEARQQGKSLEVDPSSRKNTQI